MSNKLLKCKRIGSPDKVPENLKLIETTDNQYYSVPTLEYAGVVAYHIAKQEERGKPIQIGETFLVNINNEED